MNNDRLILFHNGRRRHGQSLLMVILILVFLIGILALTLDMGFVLQARRQMQTGVNATALEGLRNVDVDDDGTTDGRESAARLMRNVYDDNLDPTTNNTTVGAGVDHTLVQGDGYQQTTLGNATGSRDLYVNRSSFIYRPDPQLNETNDQHGDLVFGEYDELATSHVEQADYSRDDFSTVLSDPTAEQAFLVRLRRTHNPLGLDRIAGISSGGNGLPLLLARFSWLAQQPAGTAYSIRRDGVTVRATAIADEEFAVRVWPQGSNDQVYGAIPFGVAKSDFIANADPTGTIQPTTIVLTHFGQPAEFSSSGSYNGETGYVAVIDDSISPARVIGFWLAKSTIHPTRQPNASARTNDAWDILGELTAEERSALYSIREETNQDATQKLLAAPVLVRSMR